MNKNIVLVGFMGSGKTTIGKLLAQSLAWNFIDTDDIAIKKSGKTSAPEVFEQLGEIGWRKYESEAISELSKQTNLVISTGGGVITNSENIVNLKKGGHLVYLQTSFETITSRLIGDTSRPLFTDIKIAHKLFETREPLYRENSDWTLDTTLKTPAELCSEILLSVSR